MRAVGILNDPEKATILTDNEHYITMKGIYVLQLVVNFYANFWQHCSSLLYLFSIAQMALLIPI